MSVHRKSRAISLDGVEGSFGVSFFQIGSILLAYLPFCIQQRLVSKEGLIIHLGANLFYDCRSSTRFILNKCAVFDYTKVYLGDRTSCSLLLNDWSLKMFFYSFRFEHKILLL